MTKLVLPLFPILFAAGASMLVASWLHDWRPGLALFLALGCISTEHKP